MVAHRINNGDGRNSSLPAPAQIGDSSTVVGVCKEGFRFVSHPWTAAVSRSLALVDNLEETLTEPVEMVTQRV
jgi:hypothetical protein